MKNPSVIHITEVGLRDGLQSLPSPVSLADKLKLVDRLYVLGLRRIELTSFVSRRRIPQMADSEQLSQAVLTDARYSDVGFTALVPNLNGAGRAVACGYRALRFFVSVSESHNLANTGQTVTASLRQFSAIREAFPSLTLSVLLATAVECPFQGRVPPSQVLTLARQLSRAGADRIGLADTLGKAKPRQLAALLDAYREGFSGDSPPFVHLHNAEGQVLANVRECLRFGIFEFDAAFGGLGGCPAIPNAQGNLATEELAALCSELEIDCGLPPAAADSLKVLGRTAACLRGNSQNAPNRFPSRGR